MELSPAVLSERLSRIEKMQGSDPGFALLALMSFVEAFLREYLDDYSPKSTLPTLLQNFGEAFGPEPHYSLSRDPQLLELLHYQKLSNTVRHHFMRISEDEYTAALHRVFSFIRRLGIKDSGLDTQMERIDRALKVWASRKSHFDDFQELMDTGFRLARSLQENEVLRSRLEKRIRQINEAGGVSTDHPVGSGDAGESYIANLRRICIYARSRRDFERSLIEPSEEQMRILRRIGGDGDFLVTGSAGTGKTLLLIMALRQYIQERSQSFEFSDATPTVSLLTYTSTLTKYNRYLSSLVDGGGPRLTFSTVDRLIMETMEEKLGGRSIEYHIESFRQLFARVYHPDCGLSPEEALDEVENYLYAHAVLREDYLETGHVRRGRGTKLTVGHRRVLWRIRDEFSRLMEDERLYTRNFGRIRLIEVLDAEIRRGIPAKFEKLFVDEVQDLNAADITLLSRLSTRGVVMAGDRDQSIFLGGFSFESAGLDVRGGNSAILRHNFRNSAPVNEFASRLRSEPTAPLRGLRPGPPVEIFQYERAEDALRLLVERAEFALGDLGYSPESLCILAPRGNDLREIQSSLHTRGIASHPVKDRRFDFSSTQGIRLSTFHSVKGLDFAGVLIYLPGELYTGPHRDDAIARNLLYVACSRAMELLWFFTGMGSVADLLSKTLEDAQSREYHETPG
jgi:hypothetical protein